MNRIFPCLFMIALVTNLQCGAARASTFDVSISTSPIQGDAGFFAFDFLGGTPIENNTVTISDFTTDGALGSLALTGGASGTLVPGPATLDDSQFFNEVLQAVSFGANASFVLDLTTNSAAGGIPDSFSFFVLDSTRTPYATSDPSGADSLFSIDVSGSELTPQVFSSGFASVSIRPAFSTVGEPSTCAFCIAGGVLSLLALLLTRAGNDVRLSRR
ncbi:MAG TPA: NF038129 family PEP-CTERM protein [Bryobacteraceae bacterium]|nr:NF038129 family PEP-CTERM protein [Bryobacteraceae bacterium]